MTLFSIFFLSSLMVATATPTEVKVSTVLVEKPLTSLVSWRLSLDKVNAHLENWQLERKAGLRGVQIVNLSKGEGPGRYTVNARTLKLENFIWVRSQNSSRFLKNSGYPCGSLSPLKVESYIGVIDKARSAAKRWEKLLKTSLPALTKSLGSIEEETEKMALEKAKRIYDLWTRSSERKYYRIEKAIRNKRESRVGCSSKVSLNELKALWVEPLRKETEVTPYLRLPAKQWNGFYSVRMIWKVGEVKISGQFLLDPNSEVNLVSPSWLRHQGINDGFIERVSGSSKKVRWRGKDFRGKRFSAMTPSLGGKRLSFGSFYLAETQVLLPPEHLSICCDGVLGRDFFRRYIIGFEPGEPMSRVQVYHPGTFDTEQSYEVFPLEEDAYGLLTSCGDAPVLRWMVSTGERGSSGRSLSCGSKQLFKKVFPRKFSSSLGLTPTDLFTRGKIYFDLPEGRVFYPTSNLNQVVLQNRTGFDLEFVHDRYRDRKLLVKRVSTRAFQLGLRKGMFILRLDGLESEDLDQWQVDRYLRGQVKDEFELEWSTAQGTRVVMVRIKHAI